MVTFITYDLTGHTLDAATIFTGLQFFNVLKTPIAFLPMCFTAVRRVGNSSRWAALIRQRCSCGNL